ncbi:5-(carboxyamino)imidazole ribonucleotide synthase [Rubrobacter aplysinae]|uniref:5-(carboxyamino)imidazole ribonucleotide synthase n=1 Tax=Rubrobacter aplysinae TaxID=909625 RepID=UPI00064BF49C|nr:5-(carboxyamino)imidazole ribonucleotide synthase [Rubrobacter aplysinae]
MSGPVLPGATVGVLGSGQLGRMLALVARRMGYRVHVYAPGSDSPAGQVADREWNADYDDRSSVATFARGVDVVTLEFENVPAATVEEVSSAVPVRPGQKALRTAQNRLREKTFLHAGGYPTAPFREVSERSALEGALREIGAPAVLKTAGFGYDGKGQARLDAAEDADEAWEAVGGEAILESRVDFEREISVVAARGVDGSFAHHGAVENAHDRHILDVTVAPADVPPEVEREAVGITRSIFEALDLVGTACVEFFLAPGGKLLVNEIAPRPHNSGHWTIEGAVTSQFEQQLRAVCGLPLGGTGQARPAAMANLIGDLWSGGEPDWEAVCSLPEVKLHLYGKAEARPVRKMGHLTAVADTAEAAENMVREARERLTASA